MSLDTWFPEPKIHKTSFGDVVPAPVTLGRIPALARAVAPFVNAMPKGDDAQEWMVFIGEHGEAMIDAMAVITGTQRADLETLSGPQSVAVAIDCVMLNMDFFVLPALLAGALAEVPRAMPGIA